MMKLCQCGCGQTFETKRKDQKYLSQKHAVNYHNSKKVRERKANKKLSGKTLLANINYIRRQQKKLLTEFTIILKETYDVFYPVEYIDTRSLIEKKYPCNVPAYFSPLVEMQDEKGQI